MTVRALQVASSAGRVCNEPYQAFVTTDLATVRDAMEATDEALARKEQEAAYMVDGEI